MAGQTQSITLETQLEFNTVSCDKVEQVFAMGSLKAPFLEANKEKRAPIDLVAVIDKSGSMSGSKLQMVKKTCEFVVKHLKKDDSFSLVTYDSGVSTDIPICKMNTKNKAKVISVLRKTKAVSCTNLSGGLLAGLDQIGKSKSGNKVASVFLFTDGLANEGITSEHGIKKAAKDMLKAIETACSVYTFGFGSDHNPTMLRGIAETGAGMYYFIETEDDIAESFGDAIGGLLSVIAQNMKLTITPVGGAKITQFLGVVKAVDGEDASDTGNDQTLSTESDEEEVVKKPSKSKKRTNRNKQAKKSPPKNTTTKPEKKPSKAIEGSTSPQSIDMGDLYSEEARDIVVGMQLPQTDTEGECPICEFTLSYFNVITCNNETITVVCNANRSKSPPKDQERAYDLDIQVNRLLTTKTMDNARKFGDASKLAEARECIQEAIDTIKSSVSASDALCQMLVDDLIDLKGDFNDKRSYEVKAKKKINWKGAAHSKQRCAGKAGVSYQTKAKKAAQKSISAFNDYDDCDDIVMSKPTATKSKHKKRIYCSPPRVGRQKTYLKTYGKKNATQNKNKNNE